MAEPSDSSSRSRRALPWQAIVAATVLALTAAAMVFVLMPGGDEEPAADQTRQTLPLTPADEVAGDPLEVAYTDADGSTGTLADRLDGRPLVVNFFASWCAPCVKEMPDFESVARELEADVDFFGLAVNDRPEDAEDIVDQTGVTYPWSRDIDGDIANAAQVVQMPTTMFIASDGTIEEVHAGALDADGLRALIEEHLGVTA